MLCLCALQCSDTKAAHHSLQSNVFAVPFLALCNLPSRQFKLVAVTLDLTQVESEISKYQRLSTYFNKVGGAIATQRLIS